MKHLSTLAIGLLIGTAAFQFSNSASGQSEGGWVTLLDSTKMGDWDEVGKANWAMKDGALAADKLDGKDLSYLVSKNSYKDFQIKAEFWTDEEANSGIFIRCDQSKKIDSKICYEVNIFDKRPGPDLRHRRDRRCRQGRSDAEGRRQMEYLRDHGAGPASRRRAQRPEDRRRAGQQARERAVRAAIRLGRGQVPQGADQAAVVTRPETKGSPVFSG